MKRVTVLCGVLLLLLLSACGDDGGGGAVKRPFQPRRESAVWSFSQVNYAGQETTFTSAWVGEKTIDGREYGRLLVGATTEQGHHEGTEVWVDWQGDTVSFGGGEVYFPLAGIAAPGEALVSGTVDTPLIFNLKPPLGELQTVTVQGSASLGDPSRPPNPYTIDTQATYTLVEEDANVETSMGPLAGCRRFEGAVDYMGLSFTGQAWYHPDLGMVAGHVSWPAPHGTTLDLMGVQDFGDPNAEWGDIQAMGVIGPGRPGFELSTYDVSGKLDANKDRHAKMLLEIRWSDPAKARTDLEPAAVTEFGTIMGYFPHRLVPSPLSIFHPEENGEGYTFWVAYVDQAAKNLPANGVTYYVSSRAADYASSEMRVTARILYHRWDGD